MIQLAFLTAGNIQGHSKKEVEFSCICLIVLWKAVYTSISADITPAHSFDSHRNQRHWSALLRSTQWDWQPDKFIRQFLFIAFWFSVDFLMPVQCSLVKWALTSRIIVVWESAKFTPCRDSISFWCWISPMYNVLNAPIAYNM